MPQPLSPEIKQLLDRPNFAHLATLMPDGSPQSVPVFPTFMDPVSHKYIGQPSPSPIQRDESRS